MADRILEYNVKILKTPLVDIEIVDEDSNNVSFDIVSSQNTYHVVRKEVGEGYVNAINYDEKTIRINTSNLQIGKKYLIKSSIPLEYLDSDPKLFTYGVKSETQTFAITFPDPHDDY